MPETIGQQLKQARNAHYLTVGEVSQATHIQARFIEAIEDDDFESLPSAVQARAFLRLYAEFLHLSLDELIAHQRADPGKSLTENPGKLHLPSQTQVPQETAKEIPSTSSEPPSDLEAQSNPEYDEKPMPEDTLAASSLGRPEQPSQVVFSDIGNALQRRRETLSLTLDEIEQHTHVRKHYLQALEEGNFNHMPSSVQMRGMLNNYARFLDMDVDAILLQFAEGLQAQRLERQPAPVEKEQALHEKSPSKKTRLNGWQRYLSMDVIIGVGLVLVLLVFAIWGTSRIIGLRSDTTPQPTPESISDILAASTEPVTLTPTPTTEAIAGTGIPAISSTPIVAVPAAGSGPVQVVVVALEEAFVRVTVDGKRLFDGRVVAGTAYPFDGNTQIEVLTGNGAAVSIIFKQSDLGPMGSLGQVVDRIYTASAILNPTATSTPTPTITPIHSLTPTSTPTSRSSSTPITPPATQ